MKNPAAPISVSSGYSSVCSVIQTGVAQLRENYMSSTYVPLYLERLGPVNAEIGAQVGDDNFLNRNCFGDVSNPLGAHTYNYCDGNNPVNVAEFFYYNNMPWRNTVNEASTGNPLHTMILKTPLNPNATISLDCEDPSFDGLGNGGGSGELSRDVATALDLTNYTDYEDLIKDNNKRMLYEKLNTDTNYRNSLSTFVNFYGGYQTTAGRKLHDYHSKMHELSDSTIFNDSAARAQKFSEAQQLLLEVYTEKNYEQNEKRIAELSLLTMEKGIDSITESDWQWVQQIANSCPLVNGYSVYDARAMYAYIDHTIYWDDTELCQNAGFFKTDETDKVTTEQKQSAKLWYDAKAETALVSYRFEGNEGGEVTVYDLLGQQVGHAALEPNNQIGFVLLPNVVSGGYLYKIRSASGFTQTGKFILIK